MENQSKSCQSCGMPIKKDPENVGTNADQTKNLKYCNYCFQNGEFTFKGTDVYAFQDFCKNKMIESGHSRFLSWIFTRGMSRLERWKK